MRLFRIVVIGATFQSLLDRSPNHVVEGTRRNLHRSRSNPQCPFYLAFEFLIDHFASLHDFHEERHLLHGSLDGGSNGVHVDVEGRSNFGIGVMVVVAMQQHLCLQGWL
jgi:hypothetical protein